MIGEVSSKIELGDIFSPNGFFFQEIVNLLYAAGDQILEIYDRDHFFSTSKEDGSPVTQADLASNTILKKGLKQLLDIPLLSEEENVSFEDRKSWDLYWMIDPLDGTKEFLKKNGEFAINLSLMCDRRPIWGGIYAPISKELYFAIKGQGAFLYVEGQLTLLSEKMKEISEDLTVVQSYSDSIEGKIKSFLSCIGVKHYLQLGSALKFCYLASGKADFYLRLIGSSEWDIAAGDLLIQETGGSLVEITTGQEILYNNPSLRVNPFFASGSQVEKKRVSQFLKLINSEG